MPELPEVEHLRATLAHSLIGRTVTRTRLSRRDILARESDPPGGFSRSKQKTPTKAVPQRELLAKARIQDITRRGKQLAIIADSGRTLCVHLGMSGQLLHLPPRQPPPKPNHIHLTATLDDRSHLIFRDPRRFGGLWTFASTQALHAARWAALGPDALTITPRELHARLLRTRRPLKAALLDQSLTAGVGNIYADEALFRAQLNPLLQTHTITKEQSAALARAIRHILRNAIKAGGSTLRDYTDARARPGSFQTRHHVYARAGLPCTRCTTPLAHDTIAQRSTVWCPQCQP